jgi:hypothetical protein
MKILSIISFVLISLMSFTVAPVRTVSANTTIGTSDNDGFVINTGAAVTFTLGTVSSGFTCTIVNQGTGNVTLSSAVTVASGQTITIIPKTASGIEPGIVGNSIRLIYDGTTWRATK